MSEVKIWDNFWKHTQCVWSAAVRVALDLRSPASVCVRQRHVHIGWQQYNSMKLNDGHGRSVFDVRYYCVSESNLSPIIVIKATHWNRVFIN